MGGIDTKGRYHVHWGPPETYGERREESALRRSGRPVPDTGLRALRADRPDGRSTTILEELRPRPEADAPDPRGDPGGLRPPAGRRAQADQPEDRRVVRDDLRHRLVLPPPPVRAARRRRDQAARARRAAAVARRPTSPASTRRSAAGRAARGGAGAGATGATGGDARRGPEPDDDDPPDARGAGRRSCSAPDAAPRTDGHGRSGRGARRGRRGGRVRGPQARASTTSGRPGTIADDRRVRPARPRRRRLPDRREVAARGAETEAPRRYVVANGYGADPSVADRPDADGARTRSRVLEGVAIAAFAIGAAEAFIAVRAEATEAIRRLEAAIGAAEDAGFVGPDILGSGRERRRSPSGPSRAPTCSARRRSCSRRSRASAASPSSGRRTPRARPVRACRRSSRTSRPSPPCRGSSPTAPRRSPRSARRTSPGTILVQVRGSGRRRRRRGAARDAAPRDRRARRASADGDLKAVLVGGPSGGILPPELLDTPYEFDALRAVGAHVGSGSVVAADERACIVDLARLLTRFCADEACGKTIPCRIGTAPDQRDRRPDRDRRAAPDRPPAPRRPVGRRRRRPPCATTSGWRPFRSRAGCDTSGPSSTSTSSAAPAPPASAARSRSRPARPAH